MIFTNYAGEQKMLENITVLATNATLYPILTKALDRTRIPGSAT